MDAWKTNLDGLLTTDKIDFIYGNTMRICTAHFEEQYIDRTSLVCVRIKPNAIPTIFPKLNSRKRKKPTSSQVKVLKLKTECTQFVINFFGY